MPTYRYRVVDVFTETPMEGNPLAVFPDAAGLDSETMLRIAKELNLSETAFVVPASRTGCDMGVRIFTPTREMLFAGHPTIGTSWVLLDEGTVRGERFVLDEPIGPVPIRVESGTRPLIWLTTPPIEFRNTADRSLCARALGLQVNDLLDIPPQDVGTGNAILFIPLRSKETVDRAWIDLRGVEELKAAVKTNAAVMSIFVFTPQSSGVYSRMFAPENGIVEDPATGGATGPLAAYMLANSLAPGARWISEQGVKMGRRSLLHVQIRGDRGAEVFDVGGHVTPLVEATMRF
jgi:trans-2,3-dihydro-3-hydroxyanthranilate isomerase